MTPEDKARARMGHAGTYRKRPVEVEAIRCDRAIYLATHNWPALPKWFVDAYDRGGLVLLNDGISVPTLEGPMLARPDWWIVQGVLGELYPCAPDVFETSFDPVLGADAGKMMREMAAERS